MNIRKTANGGAGFTLIEVMITMFFILFIVQGLAMVSLYAKKSGIYARRLTSANILAEQALERDRNQAYTNLPTLDGQTLCYDGYMNSVGCASPGAVFTEVTAVTIDTPLVNVTQVDVTVTWEEGLTWGDAAGDQQAQETHQAKITSYISRY